MLKSEGINTTESNFRVDPEKIRNKEIMDSLRYAGLIQQAMLPPPQVLNKLLTEYFILFMPKSFVSGDFYWAAHKNKQTYIVAADCTGHGVPGALMSIMGISFLNEIVSNGCPQLSNRILNQLREKIMEALNQTGEVNESRDGIDLSMCIINQDKTGLQFSGANNPLYIVRNNELMEIRADSMPVGINAVPEEPFSINNIEIRKNDMLYMFSDGFPDQFGGPDGKKFKYRPFKQLLMDIHKRKLNEQHTILKKTINNWMGDNEQTDDILILGFKIT